MFQVSKKFSIPETEVEPAFLYDFNVFQQFDFGISGKFEKKGATKNDLAPFDEKRLNFEKIINF